MSSERQNDKAQERQPAVSRRALLKVAAGTPILLTFGMLLSPLARALKPTMKPGGFFQSPDFPLPKVNIEFNMSDFPNDWSSKSFDYDLKYVVFNPEKEKIKRIPGIIVRLSEDEIVAYSRACPNGRGCFLNYKTEMCCGCVESTVRSCSCAMKRDNPVLVCPKHHSTFDLMEEGRVVSGPAPRPPWKFNVSRKGDLVVIDGFEFGIA